MPIGAIKEKIQHKLILAPTLNARAKFDFGDKGILLVDTTVTPPTIVEYAPEDGASQDADVSLTCSPDTMLAIMEGRQDPNIAFMMGKLKIKGSMRLAIKLNAFLED